MSRGKTVDRQLYQIAREEVLSKITIPVYFKNFIDPLTDLEIDPKCLCPFHEEDTPSFRYKADENFWRCFGKCQDGGTVIELHARLHDINNHHEALMDMRKRLGQRFDLNFKTIFIADLKEETIEELFERSSQSKVMSIDSFLKTDSTEKSVIRKIERYIGQFKEKDFEKYIELNIQFDQLYVDCIADKKHLEEFYKKIRGK